MATLRGDNRPYLDGIGCYFYGANIMNKNKLVIENSFIVIGNIENIGEIIANYDLYVIGSIKASKIHVKRNLITIGNIEADQILVNGDISCTEEISCKKVSSNGSLATQNLTLEDGKIEKKVNVGQSIILDGTLEAEELYCFEGIAGEGKCFVNSVFIKEYCDAEIISKASLEGPKNVNNYNVGLDLMNNNNMDFFRNDESMEMVRGIKDKFTSSLTVLFESYVQKIEEQYDIDEIAIEFKNIHKIFPELQPYTESYLQVLRISELSKIKFVEDFILLLNLKLNTPKFFYSISIVNDVLGEFFVNEREKIGELIVAKKERGNIIHNLNFLEKGKHLLNFSEYKVIYNKLVNELPRVIH